MGTHTHPILTSWCKLKPEIHTQDLLMAKPKGLKHSWIICWKKGKDRTKINLPEMTFNWQNEYRICHPTLFSAGVAVSARMWSRTWVRSVQQGQIQDQASAILTTTTTTFTSRPPVFTIWGIAIFIILNSYVIPFNVSCPVLILCRKMNRVTHCHASKSREVSDSLWAPRRDTSVPFIPTSRDDNACTRTY